MYSIIIPLFGTLLVMFLVANLFVIHQRTSYMDEIFHIPQMQNFCSYNFEVRYFLFFEI